MKERFLGELANRLHHQTTLVLALQERLSKENASDTAANDVSDEEIIETLSDVSKNLTEIQSIIESQLKAAKSHH